MCWFNQWKTTQPLKKLPSWGEELLWRIRCVHVCVWVTESCLTLWDPLDCSLPASSVHGISSLRITGVSCHFLLQGIFLTKELNLGLLHCRRILYHMSHLGRGILQASLPEWVAIPFFRVSSQPRDWTQFSCNAGRLFTIRATREWILNIQPQKI